MLNSSKVHKEVNTNYFYCFKIIDQRKEQGKEQGKYGHQGKKTLQDKHHWKHRFV